jgi:hypothetical protein
MNKFLVAASVSVLALVTAVPVAQTATQQSVPVMVYPDPENIEAQVCASSGTIKVNSFVSVRTGPGVGFNEIDRVYNGQDFAICDNHNGWYGIVYVPGGQAYGTVRCSLDIKFKKNNEQPYNGSCAHGWISKNFITNLAG